MTDFQCVISADLAARAYVAVSTEQTRYYLNGFKVESCPMGGALLVATDGHKMLVLRDPDGLVQGTAIVQLTPAMLKACKAKATKRGAYGERFLIVDGQRAAVAFTSADNRGDLLDLARNPTHEVECFQPADALIDGTFPDWRRVVPNGQRQPAAATFNGEYVAALAKALSTGRDARTRIEGRGADVGDAANSPHAVFGDGTVDGFGVLMPIRDSDRDLPAWLASAPNVVPLKQSA